MTAPHPVIGQFYEAIARGDTDQLLNTLADDFVGHVTDGLPDIGGTHHGRSAMLDGAWIPAHLTYRATPHPGGAVVGADGTTVVLGEYTGTPPATGVPFAAAFAHVFRLRDDRIAEIRQITDSHRWVTAAALETSHMETARQVYEAVRRRDLSLLLEAYADDIVIEEDPALPYGGTHTGRGGAVNHAAGYAEAWDALQDEDTRDPQEHLVASDDIVVALWTLRAARTDARLHVPAVSMLTFEHGRVARLRMHYSDSAAVSAFLAG